MAFAQSRGRAGEALAEAYLTLMGLTPRERNIRLAGVEVDLVMEEGGTQVVVEVRFRGRTDYGGAALSIDREKRGRLMRATRALEQLGARRVRIDVVTIELSDEGASLRHYRNAITE